jgi:uncharacterized protein with PQ loop repeat
MITNSAKTQSKASFSLKLEGFVLLSIGCVCLLIYLSLIAVMLISSGKVAHAPALSATQIDQLADHHH